MDSLVANYASSDDEKDEDPKQQSPYHNILYSTSNETSIVDSSFLPQPKSKSIISFSLPPPKFNPKNSDSNSQTLPIPGPPNPSPKPVIQFTPPINPSSFNADKDNNDEVKRPIRECESSFQTPSLKSMLSFLPAPKNSSALGAVPALGFGRRSMVDAELSSEDPIASDSNAENDESLFVDGSSSASSFPTESIINSDDFSNPGLVSENHESYYSFSNSEQHENNWSNDLPMLPKKRGRDDVPLEIVEVNQDDLMKNRPKEHQVKATGIAFRPSYQPVSTKGMPSKLHKRKHQIGSLYFDMKQKAAELAERRSKGFLTKAETQAKYGW